MIRQQYGFKNLEQFFKLTEHAPKMREQITGVIVKEFTGYKMQDGKLVTYNPYTSKYEALQISNFSHITKPEDLMKDLNMLYKTRMRMLEQSRDRILEISKHKKHTRDKDLEVPHDKVKERINQLAKQQQPSQERDIER